MSPTRALTAEDLVFKAASGFVRKVKKIHPNDEPFIEARFIISGLNVNDVTLRANVRRRVLNLIERFSLDFMIEPRGKDCLLVIQPTH